MRVSNPARVLLLTLIALPLIACSPTFAWADDQAAASETAVPAEVVPDPAALESRMAALATLSLDELRARAEEVEASIPKLAGEAQELVGQVREVRISMQQHEAVLAVRQEMAELQKKLERVIDEIPEVKAKAEEAAAAKTKLFEEMQFRTRLLALIAAAEKKAAPTPEAGQEEEPGSPQND